MNHPIGTYTDIVYEKKEGVAFVRMNRPRQLNAFRPTTIDEMRNAFERAWYDEEVGVVVLTVLAGSPPAVARLQIVVNGKVVVDRQ